MDKVTGLLYTAEEKIFYPRPYYRIGDFLESTNPNNPADDGYIGTWELYGKGRVTVCIDTNDSDFNTINKEIGEKKHKLTVDEMPSHSHNVSTAVKSGNESSYVTVTPVGNCDGTTFWKTGITDTKGGSQSHNNLPPSIVVYRWRRIA